MSIVWDIIRTLYVSKTKNINGDKILQHIKTFTQTETLKTKLESQYTLLFRNIPYNTIQFRNTHLQNAIIAKRSSTSPPFLRVCPS